MIKINFRERKCDFCVLPIQEVYEISIENQLLIDSLNMCFFLKLLLNRADLRANASERVNPSKHTAAMGSFVREPFDPVNFVLLT